MAVRLTILLLTLTLALPAQADEARWLRAESERHIIHARMSEAELTTLAQSMEDFAAVLEMVLPGQTRPGRKPEFHITAERWRVPQAIDQNVLGVCSDEAEAPVFYAWLRQAGQIMREQTIFFCLGQFHVGNAFFRPVPSWLEYGIPHFFSTATRDPSGAFIIGAPDPYRRLRTRVDASALHETLTTRTDPADTAAHMRFERLSRAMAAAYLVDPIGAVKLDLHIEAYAGGKNLDEAAAVLGDLDALATQIRRDLNARRVPQRRVMLPSLRRAPITVRAMGPDEVALFDLRLARVFGGASDETAGQLAALTGKYLESAPVWYEYAAAEYARVQFGDFGTKPLLRGFGFANSELIVTANPYPDAEAWRAVNKALAIDPAHAQAQRLKAEIMLSRLVRAGALADPQDYDAVRTILAPLAREPERHPLAATLYYQSYIEQGREPPDSATAQLGRAFIANAGVSDFRYAYATALSRAGKTDVARSLLTSMLNHPEFAEAARRALEAGG